MLSLTFLYEIIWYLGKNKYKDFIRIYIFNMCLTYVKNKLSKIEGYVETIMPI